MLIFHGRHYLTGDVMQALFLWFIAFICLLVPLFLVYSAWSKIKALDQRIDACDNSLLTDSSVKITEIISAPEGTIVTENATLVIATGDLNQFT